MSDNRNDGPEIDEDELLRDIQASLEEDAGDDRPSLEALFRLTAQASPTVMAERGASQSPVDGIEQSARDLRLAKKMLEQASDVLDKAEAGLSEAYRAFKLAEAEVDKTGGVLSEALAARLNAGELNAAFSASEAALARFQRALDDLKFKHAWCQSAYATYERSAMAEAGLRDALLKVGLTS